MKKLAVILSLIIAALSSLALAGCENNGDASQNKPTGISSVVQQDDGFGDSDEAGW